MVVIKHIEKLQLDFLWQGREVKEKYHVVDWAFVCKPKEEWGLRFRLVRHKSSFVGKMAVDRWQ